MAADGTHWDELPDMIAIPALAKFLDVSTKTISRYLRDGQLPPPVIRTKKSVIWRKEDVRVHFDRRARMGQ